MAMTGTDALHLSDETRDPDRFLRRLEDRLDPVHVADTGVPGLRPAAVLVPIVVRGGQPQFLFIRRPEAMREHAGQVSFPGGKIDAGESAVAAALREADEELGLRPQAARILGRFPGISTTSNYYVHPVVAWYSGEPKLAVNPREVAEAFYASVADLLDPEIYEGKVVVWEGRDGLIDYFNYRDASGDTKVIWGATGRLLHQLFRRVFDWRPPRVAASENPDFA